jgi:methylglutaconyl-CoA hydratase
MDYQTLTVAITDRIGHVTLNRPDLRNAFNEQSIAELALAFDELGRNELVRAIVLAAHAPIAAPSYGVFRM